MSELMEAIEKLAQIIANDSKIDENDFNQILSDLTKRVQEIKQSQVQE